MSGLRLYLLRHGEPASGTGAQWMFYGQHDVRLTARGEAQAHAQLQALSGVELSGIYTSDLSRTRFSASLLADSPTRPGVTELAELREMHLGVLEGVALQDARTRYPELSSRGYDEMLDWRMPQGGESVRDVANRAIPCLEQLIRSHLPPRGAGSPAAIAVVAHNTINRVALARAAGSGPEAYMRFRQRTGAINRIDIPHGARADDPWRDASIVYTNLDPTRIASTD